MNEDQKLLKQYLENQSDEAFKGLVDRYLPLVWATATRVTQSTLHADDLTQQVFLLMAKKANSLSTKPNLPGWLHRTTYHLALNQRRSDQRRTKYHRDAQHDMKSPHPSPPEETWTEIAPTLDKCLLLLSERQRSFLFLRFFRNLRWAQIADYHQTTEGAAKMQVHRALDRLRRQLERSGITLSSISLATLMQANLAPSLPLPQKAELGSQISQTLLTQPRQDPVLICPRWIFSSVCLAILAPWLFWLSWPSNQTDSTASTSISSPGFNTQRKDRPQSNPVPARPPWLDRMTLRAEATPEEKLRHALYNRHLLNRASRAAVEAALRLFGEADADAAVALLIEALQTPLDQHRWGEVISDAYYIGKEHQLALHGLQFMGASAHSAIDFLLQQINREHICHHSQYPMTIRSLSPSPDITPALVDAMDTHFYTRNVMGRELCELIADLANSNPERTQEQLLPFLDRAQPTLRVTAAYALALLNAEPPPRVSLELESHLNAKALATRQEPPVVHKTQDFLRGIMSQSVGLGDEEGRRRLAILGLGAIESPSAKALEELKIITQTSQHTTTRQAAFDALFHADPTLRSSIPALDYYLNDQANGNRLRQLIEAKEASPHDLTEALTWPSSQAAALEAINGLGSEASWAVPALMESLKSDNTTSHHAIAQVIGNIAPRALVQGLDSTNLATISAIGSALADLGPTAPWAYEALKQTHQRLPRKIHSIETALREIAPNDYQSHPEFNTIQDVVAVFQYSQGHSSKETHQLLWNLASKYGPTLSWLPKPGLNVLVNQVSEIDPQLGRELLNRLQHSFPEIELGFGQP